MSSTNVFRVRTDLDVFDARRKSREFAAKLGFGKIEREEIVIVISELATNIIKYGIRGEIALERTRDDVHGVALRIVASDVGPPISNLAAALTDGSGDQGPLDPTKLFGRRGIGAGLGAVVRLTDSFSYEPQEIGKRIVAIRYVRRPRK